ncbi:Hypothetical protein, putative [Bodo saltans]|uniref:Uncharacterized protein n=1 Tax=Bodo saltans TaxID=75058 RepID=A0A0S4JBS3_BODSA|nr:Hypothetical protein, putative [Bodo saltans]|eukprot:CUG87667.1 Hypothetical protein, putative [Bodo saltans]
MEGTKKNPFPCCDVALFALRAEAAGSERLNKKIALHSSSSCIIFKENKNICVYCFPAVTSSHHSFAGFFLPSNVRSLTQFICLFSKQRFVCPYLRFGFCIPICSFFKDLIDSCVLFTAEKRWSFFL